MTCAQCGEAEDGLMRACEWCGVWVCRQCRKTIRSGDDDSLIVCNACLEG